MKVHFGSKWKTEIERAKYVHFRAFVREMIVAKKSGVNYFSKFLGLWFRSGAWKTINGWKDFLYFAINML
jgi:hypothetical protein